MASRESVTAHFDGHAPLNSVGVVCLCGKALASMENVARKCECGRTWLISAMLLTDARAAGEGDT